MIVDRIYEYLEGEGKSVPDEVLQTLTNMVARSVRRNLGGREDSKPRNPSPSSNWGCGRRILFDSLPASVAPRERVNARSLLAFLMGDVLEQVGVLLSRQAGIDVITPDIEGRQREVTVEIGGVDMTMHFDQTFADPVHGEVVADWKSMSDFSFSSFKVAATKPSHEWWIEQRFGNVAQVRFYMMAMRLLGYGDGEVGLLLGVNKNTGHLAEVKIHRDKAEEDLLVRKAVYIANSIAEARAVVKNAPKDAVIRELLDPHLPPYPSWANVIERVNAVRLPDGSNGPAMELDTTFDKARHERPFQGWRCSYCPHVLTCFPGFGVVALDKPVYRKALTKETH